MKVVLAAQVYVRWKVVLSSDAMAKPSESGGDVTIHDFTSGAGWFILAVREFAGRRSPGGLSDPCVCYPDGIAEAVQLIRPRL